MPKPEEHFTMEERARAGVQESLAAEGKMAAFKDWVAFRAFIVFIFIFIGIWIIGVAY
jgi:hypothetical protein